MKPPSEGEPPYLGLQRFTEAEADRFYGRERLTARILARLRTEPFLAVIGSSGSGKSSLVRAGLVPQFRSHGASYEVRLLTPTSRPLDGLAVALLGAGASESNRLQLTDELGRDAGGLRRYLRRTTTTPVVLVIDQFEELFTQRRDAFEAEAFVENLVEVTEVGDARVVIALRADFYAHCAQHPRLRETLGQHQEYVGPMTAAELRRAIEAPAARGGWQLEAGLVELLLRDVGEEPGALPLLSHALLETWRRREAHRLTLAGYSASGEVRGAIAQTAERVFGALSPGEQQATRRIFVALTELGEGMPDTRRRARIAELAATQSVTSVHIVRAMRQDGTPAHIREDTEAIVRGETTRLANPPVFVKEQRACPFHDERYWVALHQDSPEEFEGSLSVRRHNPVAARRQGRALCAQQLRPSARHRLQQDAHRASRTDEWPDAPFRRRRGRVLALSLTFGSEFRHQ